MTERKLTLDKRLNLIIGNLRSIANNPEFMSKLNPTQRNSLLSIGANLVALRESLK